MSVVLVLVASIAQGVTGWLGWYVTVYRLNEKRRMLYGALFAGATLIGICATVLGAYRADKAMDLMRAKMHVDDVSFSTPSGESTIRIGLPLRARAKATNRGALSVKNLAVACELTISSMPLSAGREKLLFGKLSIHQKERLQQPNGNEVLAGADQIFECWSEDDKALSRTDIDDLENGRSLVYITILMQYGDNVGSGLTTKNCEFVFIKTPKYPVDCSNNNS